MRYGTYETSDSPILHVERRAKIAFGIAVNDYEIGQIYAFMNGDKVLVFPNGGTVVTQEWDKSGPLCKPDKSAFFVNRNDKRCKLCNGGDCRYGLIQTL